MTARLTGDRRVWVAMNVIVVSLAGWLVSLSTQYVLAHGVMRFHLENAAVLFVAAGFFVRIAHDRHGMSATAREPFPRLPYWTLPLWWACAIVLYASTLRIGFLSDDFVLAGRAAVWQIGPVHPEFFRPVPLVVWAAILRAGGGPVAIHLLNVLLHGTNAYLATRVVGPYVRDVAGVLLAGAVVLAFPLAPEAVAWASGVFDVMATTCTLMGILVARNYGSLPSVGRRTALYVCAALALLSKETAAVLPLLILLDMWCARRWTATLAVDVGCLFGTVAAVGAVRFLWASPMMKEPITKFMVQRWLFGTVGSVAFPWHLNVLYEQPHTVLVATLICISLMTAFFVGTAAPAQTRAVVMMGCFMLIGTLPVITILGVAPDLQGARYLYLPSIGWAGFLACITSGDDRRRVRPRYAVIGAAVLIAMYIVNIPVHLTPWRRAGELRDRLERAAVTNRLMTACSSIHLAELPDNVDGAYVLRNGAAEAFRRDLGKDVRAVEPLECSFAWDDTRDDLVPTKR